MKSTLIRPAIRLAWICRLVRFHWDRSMTRNSNIVDFVSECRICGRRERNMVAWPRPVANCESMNRAAFGIDHRDPGGLLHYD